ncbi:MAG: hypothetical protein E7388_01905 [Ruminococcaceae bacterium]|nr:hypothetical protein [Oscillospiraceae bacterium]
MKTAMRFSLILVAAVILTVAMVLILPEKGAQSCFSGHRDVSLVIESFDEVNKLINVKWHNNSDEVIMPKNGCTVYKKIDNQWELLDATPAFLLAIHIGPGETYDETYRVGHIDMTAGSAYKIETEFSMGEENYSISLEFEK